MKLYGKILLGLLLLGGLQADVVVTASVPVFALGGNTNYNFGAAYEADGGHKLARAANGTLHAVFGSVDSNNNRIYKLIYAYSTNNGASFSTKEITSANDASSAYLRNSAIATFGNDVYLVYSANQGGSNSGLFLQKYTNNNAQWTMVTIDNKVYDTDITIDKNGYIYIVANNSSGKIVLYRTTTANINSIQEEKYNSGDFNTSSAPAHLPALAAAPDGQIYLAYELRNTPGNTNTSKSLALHTRLPQGGWSGPTAIAPNYRAQHPDIVFHNGSLHLVYAQQLTDINQDISLYYRVYNTNLTSYTEQLITTAKKIYSPRLSFSGDIPVIQYVRSSDGSSYRVQQTSAKASGGWTDPAVISDTTDAVYVHTVPEIINDMPDVLWYNNTDKKVYFNDKDTSSDKIAPIGSVTINNGATYATALNVKLSLQATGASQMNISNSTTPGNWDPYATHNNSYVWNLVSGDGLKTVYAQYRDTAGNTTTVTDNIYLDTVTPAITSGLNTIISSQNMLTAFSWTATDNPKDSYASGIAQYKIYWGDSASGTSSATQAGSSYTPAALSVEKTYYLRVQPVDKAGNEGSWNTVVQYTYDKTPPSSGSITVSGGAAYTNTRNVSLGFSAVGATQMQVSNNASFTGSGWETYKTTSGNWLLDNNDGLKTVYAKYKDAAGNESAAVQDTIYLDTATPSIISSPAAATSNNKTPGPFTWTATDNHKNNYASGVVTYNIYWGNVSNGETITTSKVSPNHNYTPGTLNTEGTYYLRVQPVDKAGNTGNWVTVAQYTLDTTTPVGAVTINNGAVYTTTVNVSLALKAVDTASGLVSMNISNSSAPGSWLTYAESTNYLWQLDPGDGQKTVFAWYRDKAGNASNAVSDTIYLDTVTPAITSSPDSMVSNNSSPAFSWTATDNHKNNYASGVATYNIYWGNVSNGETITATKVSPNSNYAPGTLSADGTYYLRVQPVDKAGNTGNWVTVAQYTLDTTTPVGAVTINNGAVYTVTVNVNLALKAADTASGLASMNISNSSAPGSWLTYAESTNYLWQLDPGDGQKTVYVRYRDAAGNETLATDDIILDSTAPAGSVTINDGASLTKNAVLYLTLAASADTVSMNISETESPGSWETFQQNSIYELQDKATGNKTLYVWFRDRAGNVSATLSASIVLSDAGGSGGSVIINNGTAYASSNIVNLTIDSIDPLAHSMRLWNEGASPAASWIPVNPSIANWDLNSGTIVSDGLKTVYIEFKNSFGNVTWNGSSAAIILDTTAPTGTVTINNGETLTINPTLYLDFSAAADTVSMNISETHTPGVNWLTYSQTHTYQLNDTATGSHTIYVWFRDKAGNISAALSDSITISDTGGSGGSVIINNGAAYTNELTVSLAISEIDNLASDMRIWSADNPGAWEAVANTKTWTFSAVDGEKVINIEFRNSFGNITWNGSGDSIILDMTKPTGLLQINNAETLTKNALLQLNIAGVPADTVSMNISETESPGSWETFQQNSAYELQDKTAGNKTLYVWLRDRAGNVSATLSASIVLSDTGGSGGSVVINNGAAYASSNIVNLTIDSIDPLAYSMRLWNEGASPAASWVPVDSSISNWDLNSGLSSGDGSRAIHIEFQNSFGNITWNGAPAAIILDTTAPTGSVTINNGETLTTNPTLYLALAADPDTVSMNISETLAYADAQWVPFHTAQLYTLTSVTTGDRTIYVWFADRAGNISAPVSASIILDTPPGPDSEVASNHFEASTGEKIYSYPNPAKPAQEDIHIAYVTDFDGWTNVYVYNVLGERVWHINNYARAGAKNLVTWNGRNNNGRLSGNGIYILLLTNEKKKVIARGRLTILDE